MFFRRKFFVSQCRIFPLGGILQCFINFEYQKSLDKRGGGEYQDFPSNFFCLTVPKKFVGEPFSVSLISGTEKVWIGGGSSRFSVEIFTSHSAENFPKEILLFLRKFSVSKNLVDKKGVSQVSVEIFLSHSAEEFREHPFNVSEILGYRKILCIIGVITFPLKIFCLTVPKNFVKEPFSVSLISGIKKC